MAPQSNAPAILERVSLVAPLGIRFMDTATGATAIGGLNVAARPAGRPAAAVPAQTTPSGLYAFVHLPGLRDLEAGDGTAAYWSGIPADARRALRVTVDDSQGRFLPCSFSATVPFQGLFDPACLPADLPGSTLPLFSAPARPVPAGLAVVRAELRSAQRPAAHAMLEVRLPGGLLGRGLADDKGRVVVLFPYPDGPIAQPRPLLQRQWTLTLRTLYDPNLALGELPDLCAVLSQPVASLLASPTATLIYGQELFVR